MEIGKKIMDLRKKSGFSQEELAEKIGVARQTISKWELGETSPDLKQAKELSKIFNVSLDELVDNDIKNILVEKTSNTEKLAGLILKLIKFMVVFVIVLPILLIVLRIVFKNIYEHNAGRLMNVSIKCNLHDETYGYEFDYYENNGEIKDAGGDGYLANITGIGKYSDVYQTLDVIDSTIATISNNRSEFRLNCAKVDEYLDLDLDATGTQLSMTTADFNTLVNQTAFAASLKEQRPILTALNLEAKDGVLTATATDSARMARKTLSIPLGVEFLANVPAKMMVEVSHLLEGKDSLDIAFSDKKALFTIGTTVVATRLIAGDYPNTKNIVPKITNYSLEVNANDLMKAIERANILSIDRENVVDLTMSEDGVEISAKSSQVGSAVEKIDIFKYVGQNLKVSFNSEFVIAAVKALGSADVTFAFVGEMKPFIVENASDDSVVQIVTPVRTY